MAPATKAKTEADEASSTPLGSASPMRDVVLQGDCLDVLRGLPSCSVDAIVTDPPYGLGAAPDMLDVLRAWLAGEVYTPRGSGGFMGKAWDAFVPGPEYWREVFRVLKPGGHALVFAGTRTWDVMGLALRLAGFELRDTLQWLYGSGFPKSHNISVALDKMAGAERTERVWKDRYQDGRTRTTQEEGHAHISFGCDANGNEVTLPATAAAQQWDGWGTALKPAWEPILVCRKPPAEGTIAANVLAYGTGALHVDACRVAGAVPIREDRGKDSGSIFANNSRHPAGMSTAGRWPPNVVLSHSIWCERIGTTRVRGSRIEKPCTYHGEPGAFGHGQDRPARGIGDAEGMETVETWRCAPGCPVAELDRQSGKLHARGNAGASKGGGGMYGHGLTINHFGAGDTGGASRFFPQFHPSLDDDAATETPPFLYQAKASRRERNAGCEDLPVRGVHRYGAGLVQGQHPEAPVIERNTHPTVKPLDLMRWLCRLVARPGALILDPFGGSGTTGVACVAEGMHYLLIEREAEYVAIARKRIAAMQQSTAPVSTANTQAKPKSKRKPTTRPQQQQQRRPQSTPPPASVPTPLTWTEASA